MLTKRCFYNDESSIHPVILCRNIRASIKKNKNSIIDSTFSTEKYDYNNIYSGMCSIKIKKLLKKKENVAREKCNKLIVKKRRAFRMDKICYIENIGLD